MPDALASRRLRRAGLAALALAFVAAYAPFAAVHMDLARDVWIARRLLDGAEFPLSGPVLAGTIHLGPIWYYVLAAALALGHGWLGAIVVLLALASLEFPLAYLAGKAAVDRRAGLLWAAGLAVPSWSSFEPLLPLHFVFSSALDLAFAVCALRYAKRPRRKYLVAMALGVVLALHAHPANAGLFWVLGALAAWSLRRGACSARDCAVAIAVGAVPLLPYLVWDAAHGFADLSAGLAFVGDPARRGGAARIVPTLVQSAIGGTYYWFRSVLAWPIAAAAAATAVIGALEAAGVAGALLALRRRDRRRLVVAAFAAAAATLLTIALIRASTPFYMTTPLRVLALGIVACGLALLGESAPARLVRRLFAGVALAAGVVAALAVDAHQRRGDLPFAFLPIFDVAAPPQPAAPLALKPAYAMAASGRFLCRAAPAGVHGLLAQQLVHDYGIEMRLRCGSADVRLGGDDADRRHWIGLSRALLARVGVEPSLHVGPLGLLPAKPVASASVAASALPQEPLYPALQPRLDDAALRRFRVALAPHEHLAVT
ncbi:MAG TPA: hypothetical protein VGC30_08075, partial [Dokdonella sp.]